MPTRSGFGRNSSYFFSTPLRLSGIHLPGANLAGCYWWGANLTDANLEGADLSDANLSQANASGAKLRGANLARAKLSEACFTTADLTDANLTDADLSRVNLYGLRIPGATLKGAKLLGSPVVAAVAGEVEYVAKSGFRNLYQWVAFRHEGAPTKLSFGCVYAALDWWLDVSPSQLLRYHGIDLEFWELGPARALAAATNL